MVNALVTQWVQCYGQDRNEVDSSTDRSDNRVTRAAVHESPKRPILLRNRMFADCAPQSLEFPHFVLQVAPDARIDVAELGRDSELGRRRPWP